MKTSWILALVIFASLFLYADTKSEVALKAQLAAAQAALDAAVKDRATLSAAMAKLNSDAATRAQTAVTSTKSASATVAAASTLAAANSAASQSIQQTNGYMAQRAAIEASAAQQATTAAVNTAAAMARTQNTALMITSGFGFMAVLTGFLFQAFTANRTANNAKRTAERVAAEATATAERDHRWAVEADERAAAHRALELSKIAEVKASADLAYTEANTVNKKIASIGVQLKDGTLLDNRPEVKE